MCFSRLCRMTAWQNFSAVFVIVVGRNGHSFFGKHFIFRIFMELFTGSMIAFADFRAVFQTITEKTTVQEYRLKKQNGSDQKGKLGPEQHSFS